MNLDPGLRWSVSRADLARTRTDPDPDSPLARPLQAGEVRLSIVHFALTANNVTYAAFGDAMKYWQFFTHADPAWAHVPVWGFATVAESRVEGLLPGRRLWGYLPPGTHLVLRPGRLGRQGFSDESAHRQELAAVYNQYLFCDADPVWEPQTEGLQAVLRPLFSTAFLLDDFLAEQDFFGADQLLLSSASSKTAYATAFCLAKRRGQARMPRVLGWTSSSRQGFSQSLGCYDQVLDYDALHTLDPTLRTVYVDFAGNAALRRSVHQYFGERLSYSSAIGGTHWEALGPGSGLPGPRPALFFAPAQMSKRSAPPPAGWGLSVLPQRLGQAWSEFMVQVQAPAAPWIGIARVQGAAALDTTWQQLLAGQADPRQGCLISLQA